MQQSQKEYVKYKVMAYVQRLSLNKQINFETKITWKRNVNKVETDIVTHQDCQSVFNQMLQLQLNLVSNPLEAKFQPKFTEFAITVIYKGKIKSGGYAKFDAADIVNNNYSDERVRLSLIQCPDPQAYLQIVFNYEVIDEASRSLFNELSMLNPMGFEQDLSQIDFQEDDERKRQSLQMDGEYSNRDSMADRVQQNEGRRSITQQNYENTQRQSEKQNESSPFKEKQYNKIYNILDKFENMSRRFRSSQKSFFQEDHNSTKNQSLEVSCIPNEQQQRLKSRITQLQRQLQNREELLSEYQRELDKNRRYITQLEIKVELLQQKEEKYEPVPIESDKGLKILAQSQSKYRFLYEKTLSQLQQIKNMALATDANFSKQDFKFSKFVDELKQIEQVPEFNNDQNSSSQKIEELQRQNLELQTKIASISHNIAQIFNAAYDYGGAKLLDYLQSSIGLIESEN